METVTGWRKSVEAEVARRRVERASRPAWHWTQALHLEIGLDIDMEWPDYFIKWSNLVEKKSAPPLPTAEALRRRTDSVVATTVSQIRAGNVLMTGPVPKRPKVDLSENREEEGVSERALDAFNAVWAMEFGAQWANPFRIRLTPEACEKLGMADYYQKIPNPCDLALIKERLPNYKNDAELRQDIALVAANTRRYHPADSPLIAFSDSILRNFDMRAGTSTTTAP